MLRRVPLDVLDKLSFKQIFAFWIGYMAVFGVIYYLLSFIPGQGVLYHGEQIGHGIRSLLTAEYFSFITAASASQGYGDLFPLGVSRVFAVVEAVSGLVIFGVIISKLLSQKQETLLQEVYEISYDEKATRVRSAFYLFRSDANKVLETIENGRMSERRLQDLWITFTTLESAVYEAAKIIHPRANNRYVKQIDPLNIELLLNSIGLSLAKAADLLAALDERGLTWRTDVMNSIIAAVGTSISSITEHLAKRELDRKTLDKMSDIRLLTERLKERAMMVAAAP